MKRQKPFTGWEVTRFAGQSWRVFCAMGCNLFYPVLIFLLNAMTEGKFCTMIWYFYEIIDDSA